MPLRRAPPFARTLLSEGEEEEKKASLNATVTSLNATDPMQSEDIQNPKNASSHFENSQNGTEKNREGKNHSKELEMSFGMRPFGPLSKFQPPYNPDLRWTGYFLEESVAVVLQNSDNIILDCTVIEVRKEEEQVLAQKTLGKLMEMIPLDLPQMIRVITSCGHLLQNKIQPRRVNRHEQQQQHMESYDTDGSSQFFSPVIFPGTLWCGMKDRAERYELLGDRLKLDNCCRTHDHCPLKVGSFETRYGVTHFGFGTRSHCLCENEFFQCLKRAKREVADMIGNIYFNVLRGECLREPSQKPSDILVNHKDVNNSLYVCQVFDDKNKCRFWAKRKLNYAYTFGSFDMKY